MRRLLLVIFLAAINVINAQIAFSKYLTNTLTNSSFDVVTELNNHSGYLMLGTHYATQHYTYVIRTDTGLQAIWSRRFSFDAPYDNASFRDIGQFPTGEYYLVGNTGSEYVLLILDTNGLVLHQTAIHETTHNASVGWFAHTRICPDSSLLIATAEYEWAGFYRFDHQLNLLSAGFSQAAPNINSSGNDCIMLHDHNLLYSISCSSGSGVVKCTTQGTILWSKIYSGTGTIFSLHEGSDGSIYVGNNLSYPQLAKLDSTGNLIWNRSYNTTPNNIGNAVIRNIYPMTNGHLFLFTDSLFFEADTSGSPMNPSYVMPQHYNLGELRMAGTDFLFCSILYQGNLNSYPTVMRFQSPSGSICLNPRSIVATNETASLVSTTVQQQTPVCALQNVVYHDTLFPFGYDPIPGCFPDITGITPVDPVSENGLVFPNPTAGTVTVKLSDPAIKGPMNICVLDANGQSVFSGEMSGAIFTLNTESFAAGMYYIRVFSNGLPVAGARLSVVH